MRSSFVRRPPLPGAPAARRPARRRGDRPAGDGRLRLPEGARAKPCSTTQVLYKLFLGGLTVETSLKRQKRTSTPKSDLSKSFQFLKPTPDCLTRAAHHAMCVGSPKAEGGQTTAQAAQGLVGPSHCPGSCNGFCLKTIKRKTEWLIRRNEWPMVTVSLFMSQILDFWHIWLQHVDQMYQRTSV